MESRCRAGTAPSGSATRFKPPRDLLSAKNSWSWGSDQDRAFQEVKEELSRPTVLALYSPQVETKVSADSSSFGLGAVLLQRQTSDSAWKPVAYASRAFTETEGCYAQIEKKAQNISQWRHHKPLVSLLGNKNLDNLTPTGHLGVQKCLSRAKASVWWPGMTGQLKRKIQECRECREHLVQRKEPLIPSKLPAYPWEEVGADLFQLRGVTYLLVVDYFSKFPELIKLTSTTASNVINALKAVFARHGIPSCLRSDNGPQFDCSEMEAFATSYGFKHRTSSPRFPQGNGQVELWNW